MSGVPTQSESPPSQFGGVVLVVFTLLGWSSVPLFLRYFAEDIDGWTSNGWRYGFAALMWLPVLLVAAARRKMPKGLFVAALVPTAFNIVGQVCFTWAHYMLDPGMLTFALRAHIVFVTIGAALLFASEREVIRRPLFLLGVVLVIGGTSATILFAPEQPSTASEASGVLADDPALARTLGVALSIAAGALFACYALSVRKFMVGVNSILAFAAISQYTALAMVGLMLGLGTSYGLTALPTAWHESTGNLTVLAFWLLLASSFIGIALGHVAYYMSINRLGVAVASGVIQLQPFVVSIASLVLFKELLTGGQWVAGAIAVAGAGSMLWSQHRAQRGKPPLFAAWRQAATNTTQPEELPADHVAAASMASEDRAERSLGRAEGTE